MNIKQIQRALLYTIVWATSICLSTSIMGTPTFDDLKSDLDSGGIKQRQAIWYVFQHNQFELLPYIAGYLKSDDTSPKVQLTVLHTMWAFQDNLERYLPNWPTLLDDYIHKGLSKKNILKSISIINFFKEGRMIHALLRLTDDTRGDIRLATFQTIDNLGNDRLIPILLSMAHHKRAIYRLYAFEAMTKFRDKRLVPLIQRALSDNSKSVRIYAILALAKQHGSRNLNYNASKQFSKEKNSEVRKRVIEVIRKEKWHNLSYIVHRGISDIDNNVRKESLWATQTLNNKAAASFISRQLSTEKDQNLIKMQMDTLCHLKQSGYARGLSYVLNNNKDKILRARAAFSIGYLRDTTGVASLKSSLGYDTAIHTRIESAWALSKFREISVSNTLQKTIRNQNEDYRVRSAAFLALKKQDTYESRRLLNESIDLVESNHLSRQIQRIYSLSRN